MSKVTLSAASVFSNGSNEILKQVLINDANIGLLVYDMTQPFDVAKRMMGIVAEEFIPDKDPAELASILIESMTHAINMNVFEPTTDITNHFYGILREELSNLLDHKDYVSSILKMIVHDDEYFLIENLLREHFSYVYNDYPGDIAILPYYVRYEELIDGSGNYILSLIVYSGNPYDRV